MSMEARFKKKIFESSGIEDMMLSEAENAKEWNRIFFDMLSGKYWLTDQLIH